MALDARKKQQKVEKRKAKERAKKQSLKVFERKQSNLTKEAVGVGRILHCCASDTTWTQGLGHVLLARELPGHQVAFANFLVDMYAMGVKNAMLEIAPRLMYEKGCYERLAAEYEMRPLTPECLRNLVEGAVEFARHNGFMPHRDYAKAKAIFGDIDGSLCTQQFEYGRGGRPVIIPGPYDDPSTVMRALKRTAADASVQDLSLTLEALKAIEEEINAANDDVQ